MSGGGGGLGCVPWWGGRAGEGSAGEGAGRRDPGYKGGEGSGPAPAEGMALLLLLLGLGLGLASAQELNLQSVVRGNYDPAKVGQGRPPGTGHCAPQPGSLACSGRCS